MTIVIDIPEEIYKASQIINVKSEDVIQIPLEVIANATPLPKGHGGLIDRKLAINDFRGLCEFHYYEDYIRMRNYLESLPIIIEADKEDIKNA